MGSTDFWTTGYTRAELDAAQDKYGLSFPPDLLELLLEKRPSRAPDWRTDDDAIRNRLAWPLEGIVFDIEQNDFWMADWGERPTAPEDRAEIAAKAVRDAPPLIPLFAHRYLPANPEEAGNPVLSVYQTDIIYYGANLAHYFDNEINGWSSLPASSYRKIRFWSDIAA